MCNVGQSWNHRSRNWKNENFSRSRQFNYQNIPCDLTKKMNTYTLCCCPLIRKLQAFEILKWAKESQWKKQRTSNFTVKYNLYFHCSENTTFYEILLLFKYAFYLINIFHYFITLYIIKRFINIKTGWNYIAQLCLPYSQITSMYVRHHYLFKTKWNSYRPWKWVLHQRHLQSNWSQMLCN